MLGLVGKKIGMSRVYDSNGTVVPVTLIQLYECCVSDVNQIEDKDYVNVVLSYDKPKNAEKKLNKSILGIYKKKNLEPYAKMMTVRMSKDKTFNIGDILKADLLKDVASVDIVGISKGKGFAGGMKRWNFKGLEATHGVSVSHRSIGSTGNRMSPSKVFKNKKMPGQLGDEQVTIKNLKVVDIDSTDNLICVKGAIPGFKGRDVLIKTAKRK
ncbi:MAG TPA: 50S ribosomal protein L3 [Rickettsiales bacterium]|nr:50S ribosomal protein L3 [Rickettsiales bacterium]